MKTPKFEGAFKWGPFRQQLLSLRDDVQSIRKIAGKNVTKSEYPGKGTVVNVADTSARRPSGGGGGTTGACCYDDGTCDDLTESDCTDAGGNYQGAGTNCDDTPCLGACCYPDGTCTADMTKSDCETGGGTFQDFGSDCDPNPCPQPTGACCELDGSCTVKTSADCASSGGTYQGDSTLCADVTCTPRCCGFPAFDGSGRIFRTMTVTGTTSCGDCSETTIWTVDPVTCTPSGSGSDCGFLYGPATNSGCSGGDAWCIPPLLSCDDLSVTATTLSVRARGTPCPDPTYHETANATLSDECFPAP